MAEDGREGGLLSVGEGGGLSRCPALLLLPLRYPSPLTGGLAERLLPAPELTPSWIELLFACRWRDEGDMLLAVGLAGPCPPPAPAPAPPAALSEFELAFSRRYAALGGAAAGLWVWFPRLPAPRPAKPYPSPASL